jgi:hypothetical protein
VAGGLNKQFMRNPAVFLQTHTLMVNPQAYGSQAIGGGQASIDLVMADNKTNPKFVRLESYDLRKHSWGSEAILSYYLPAIVDNYATQQIGNARQYMFTPDLSGCLFAAYGADANNLTVEHVNVRTANAPAGLIANRAAAALNGGFAFVRILAPTAIAGAGPPNVVTYASGANVVGVRGAGGWTFVYRADQQPVAQL